MAADGLEKRKLLCEYFATVSPNGSIRDAWTKYKEVVDKHLEEDKIDNVKSAELREKVKNNTATSIDIDNLTKLPPTKVGGLAQWGAGD